MSKLSDFQFMNDIQLQSFKDEVRNILNFGKYQKQVVTTVPSWSANLGEEVLLRPTSGGTTNYFYAGTAWVSSWSVVV